MKAFIQTKMIRWARERGHTSLEDLAQKISVHPSRLHDWENENDLPTLRQAQALANALHIPLAWLYLKTPPDDSATIPDLRTIENEEVNSLSPDFKDLLNEVLYKRQQYAELIIEEGATPLKFISSYSTKDSVEDLADDIGKTLRITDQVRLEATNSDGFIKSLVELAEDQGIVVMRSGIVGNNTHRPLSVSEFRGFAIVDEYAPLIFINGRDAKAAQIFTLAHELAHLWVGQSGVSNPNLGSTSRVHEKAVERFCNKVAAELLVPTTAFKSKWSALKDTEDNLNALVRHFRVSKLVMLHRAFDIGHITHDHFTSLYAEELRNLKSRSSQSSRGGNHYATLPVRNSALLTETILHHAYEGNILFGEACNILGAKMKSITELAIRMGTTS